jgi:hypothetical protein
MRTVQLVAFLAAIRTYNEHQKEGAMAPNSSEFYRSEIEGILFTAVLSADGPYIMRMEKGGYCNGGVAMGHCTSIRYIDPSSPCLFDADKTGWWVVKYNNQPRISLEDLSEQGRQKVSRCFGIPMSNPMTGRSEMHGVDSFLQSDAFNGLCEWTKKHPRLAKNYETCQDYMPWCRLVKEAQHENVTRIRHS